MFTIIHTEEELNKLRISGKIVGLIHKELKQLIKPGITTYFLEQETLRLIKQYEAKPSFLGYKNYPYATCISINNTIVHGFPNKKTILKEGDVLSIDVGIQKNGYHGDAAFTTTIGKTNKEDSLLVKTAEKCLFKAISLAKDGVSIGTLGNKIESVAKSYNFEVVKNFVGHGIGRNLHEFPQIKNYGKINEGVILKAGMCICIEPMLVKDSADNIILDNDWEVVTANGNNAAHFEHQIIIHKNQAEIISIF